MPWSEVQREAIEEARTVGTRALSRATGETKRLAGQAKVGEALAADLGKSGDELAAASEVFELCAAALTLVEQVVQREADRMLEV